MENHRPLSFSSAHCWIMSELLMFDVSQCISRHVVLCPDLRDFMKNGFSLSELLFFCG